MRLITIKIYKGDTYKGWVLPKEVASTKEEKISATFERDSADTLRGLTFEEEKKYLPNIIGTTPDSQHWREATKQYWSNMVIIVPEEGLILNIDTYPEGHPRAGEPENLQQYIYYRFAIKHGDVAPDRNSVSWPQHKFYVLDETVSKKEQTEAFELRTKANKAFMFLQSDKGKEKLEWVAIALKGKNDKVPKTEQELLMFIESKKDTVEEGVPVGLTSFLKVMNDADLEHRALLYKLLSKGTIEKAGNGYFYGNEALGEEREAIAYLKNPVNSQTLLQLKEHLKASLV